jgi:4-amino-4-deoxy-L-arabinose transferase-like glycosyltransferase
MKGAVEHFRAPPADGEPAAADHLRLIVSLAAFGAAGVFFATSRYGPGLTPDSANYFSAAAGISSGQGLVSAAGEPLVHFPPVFPAILAAVGVFGIDDASAVRLLNALCFVFVIGATVSLVRRVTASTVASFFAGAFVLFSAPLLDAFTHAWSEAPFVAVLACFTLLVARFVGRGRARGIATLAAVAAVLPLTRYVGVLIIPAGALVIVAMSPGSERRRRVRALQFSVGAGLPLAAWLARNVRLSGTLTGERSVATASPVSVLRGFVASVADWLVPWDWVMALRAYSDARWALLLFFLGAVAVGAWFAWHLLAWWRGRGEDSESRAIIGFLVLWVVLYATFLCLAAMLVSFNPVEPRLLVPLLFPAVVLAAAALSAVGHGRRWAKRSGRDRHPREGSTVAAGHLPILILVVGVLVLGFQAGRGVSLLLHKRAEGAGGYATDAWQQAPFVERLVAVPPPVDALTNGPDVLFLLTGQRHRWVPASGDAAEIASLVSALERHEPVSVVWFDGIDWRPYLVSRQDLLALDVFTEVYAVTGGTLYEGRNR